MVDKVIVSNAGAMATKYGTIAPIQAACARMIASDAARGIATVVIEIDSASQMAAVGGINVVNSTDDRGAKVAVDAICAAHNPDYVMLLDGPDVIPHVLLHMVPGLPNDPDQNIPSDLPYASPAGFSRMPNRYLTATRVVGRLPLPEMPPLPRTVGTAQDLAMLIDNAANFRTAAAGHYSSYFAISAAVWSQSTQLSLNAVFGNATSLSLSPNAGHPGINPRLSRPAHFINCHGATADPQFYGEPGSPHFPVAMASGSLVPHIVPGTVAAAECCYGAELYNHLLANVDPPICSTYLANGAVAFLGSTSIAYGPAASNGQADLICQYFLEEVLNGRSTGSALLNARQRFVSSQKMADPMNLKTVAQFILLGDPSLCPCPPAAETADELVEANPENRESKRKAARVAQHSKGITVASAATYPKLSKADRSTADPQLLALAASRNFDPAGLTLLDVVGGTQYMQSAHAFGSEQRIATFMKVEETGNPKLTLLRVLTAFLSDGRIVKVEEAVRR